MKQRVVGSDDSFVASCMVAKVRKDCMLIFRLGNFYLQGYFLVTFKGTVDNFCIVNIEYNQLIMSCVISISHRPINTSSDYIHSNH
jgi:hypothetical protein